MNKDIVFILSAWVVNIGLCTGIVKIIDKILKY